MHSHEHRNLKAAWHFSDGFHEIMQTAVTQCRSHNAYVHRYRTRSANGVISHEYKYFRRIGFTIVTPTFPSPFHRCHCLNLLSFLEFLVSLSCTGGMASVNGRIFLQGRRSFLLSETCFQCPAESSGRHMQSGEKNTVGVWYPAHYSSHAFHRLRHYSCQRFRHIYCYFEFVRSRRQPPWQKIRYLFQQVGWSTIFKRIRKKIPSIRPHRTMLHEL